MRPLLTEAEVAALLNCTGHVVRRLPIRRVYLDPVRTRKRRYTQETVEEYLRLIGANPPASRGGRVRNRNRVAAASKPAAPKSTGNAFEEAVKRHPALTPAQRRKAQMAAMVGSSKRRDE